MKLEIPADLRESLIRNGFSSDEIATMVAKANTESTPLRVLLAEALAQRQEADFLRRSKENLVFSPSTLPPRERIVAGEKPSGPRHVPVYSKKVLDAAGRDEAREKLRAAIEALRDQEGEE